MQPEPAPQEGGIRVAAPPSPSVAECGRWYNQWATVQRELESFQLRHFGDQLTNATPTASVVGFPAAATNTRMASLHCFFSDCASRRGNSPPSSTHWIRVGRRGTSGLRKVQLQCLPDALDGNCTGSVGLPLVSPAAAVGGGRLSSLQHWQGCGPVAAMDGIHRSVVEHAPMPSVWIVTNMWVCTKGL
eukprot:960370-Amphidinium_carterae.1